jgi:CTP:molybdopterin cytidylyltransferase MocA
MSVAGIVLAAGEGIRFGGPKALALSGDRTWLEVAISTLLHGGCRPVIVVLGASAATARAGVRLHRPGPEPRGDAPDPTTDDPRILWVVNESWQSGRTGSLQAGLRALPPEVPAVVIHAVDHPDVRSETVARLIAACRPPIPAAASLPPTPGGFPADPGKTLGESIFLPVHGGRRGHPVLLQRAVWPEVLALAPDESLRNTIRRDAARVGEVEVDDPAIHGNRNEREPGDPSRPAGTERRNP